MSPLSHDEFFTKLADLFTTTKSNLKGSIFLTQKRLSYNPSESQTPSPTSDDPLTAVFPDLTTTLAPAPILIRATNGKSKAARKRGKKVKLSTVVQPDELEAFYGRYAEVCRAGMSALKPRDRTKRKAKAKRRKGGASA